MLMPVLGSFFSSGTFQVSLLLGHHPFMNNGTEGAGGIGRVAPPHSFSIPGSFPLFLNLMDEISKRFLFAKNFVSTTFYSSLLSSH